MPGLCPDVSQAFGFTGGQGWRYPRRATYQVRSCYQSHDCQSARVTVPPSPLVQANDVIEKERMSAFGTKRTSLVALHMSAFGGEADIMRTVGNVR